jgi:hypothetical protein
MNLHFTKISKLGPFNSKVVQDTFIINSLCLPATATIKKNITLNYMPVPITLKIERSLDCGR